MGELPEEDGVAGLPVDLAEWAAGAAEVDLVEGAALGEEEGVVLAVVAPQGDGR